jgi:hypothetical protein
VGTLGCYGAYAVIIYLHHLPLAAVFTIGVLTFLAGRSGDAT